MEFKKAITNSSIMNKVSLLSIDNNDVLTEKVMNESKDFVTLDGAHSNKVEEKDMLEMFQLINLNKINDPQSDNKVNENIDITTDKKTNDSDYENMLVGKFVSGFRLDDECRPPKEQNEFKDNSRINYKTRDTQDPLNKNNVPDKVPQIGHKLNENIDITIDNETSDSDYENMLVGKFVFGLRLDDECRPPKEQNELNVTSTINYTKSGTPDPDKKDIDSDSEAASKRSNQNQLSCSNLNIPQNFEIKTAIADGSCFFDSFRQGLEQLSIMVNTGDLRYICKDFAKHSPPQWFVTALENSFHLSGARRESVPLYIENIQKNERWGDPDVEGRILCKHYKISMYLIEKQQTETGTVYISQIVSADGCKCVTNIDFSRENTIYIINNGQGHFEPILRILNQTHENIANKTGLIKNEIPKKIQRQSSLHTKSAVSISSKGHQVAIETLNKLENAIKKGDIDGLNYLIQLLYQSADKSLLADIYNDKNNTIRETHLITLSCKYNQPYVLDFLLHKTNILCYLPNEGPNVDKAYVEAMCYVMKLHDIQMLELLYDYWCGEVHWPGCGDNSDEDNVNIANLERLNMLMMKARDECCISLIRNQQMLVDVHCLICFNAFQIELYTELSKLKTQRNKSNVQDDIDCRKNEVDILRRVLMTAFNIYGKYSNKNIRLTKGLKVDQMKLQSLLNEDSLYMKYWYFLMYEIYYRKLDFRIALLIINNLHLLKLRLELLGDTYQDIEATLYYYLYRVNEDWKLYLPENRPIYYDSALAEDKGLIQPVKVLYDPHRIYNGPVIYLERRKFIKSLNKFKTALEQINTDNLRPKGTKLPKNEINNLSLLPYLRDDYSLKKILQYLDQVSYLNMDNDKLNTMLIIQRIIQITGEFFKSTEQSCHLSPNTLALIQTEMPKTAYKYLFDLRDDISHARWGKLIKRIDLENSENPVYYQIIKDLKEIKKAVMNVIDIYKPILEKSLIRLGLNLIGERCDELPENALLYRSSIQVINHSFEVLGHELYINMENDFLNKEWKKFGYTRQLFREIACLMKNSDDLSKQWTARNEEGIKKVINKMPIFLTSIQKTLDLITDNNKVWQNIMKELKQLLPLSTLSVSKYPNTKCILDLKSKVKAFQTKGRRGDTSDSLKKSLASLEDWTSEWNQIKQLMDLMVNKIGIFDKDHREIKRSAFTNECKKIMNSDPDDDGIQSVTWVLNCIKACYQISVSGPCNESYTYDGIQTMASLLKQSRFFCTQKEIDYIKSYTLNFTCHCKNQDNCKHKKIFQKLYANNVISESDCELLGNCIKDAKFNRVIKNLTNGSGRENMLECLANRVNILYALFEGETDIDTLVLRYKHDVKFRMAFELVVSDIMNVFCEKLPALVNTSYTKLLAEYPLRNILEHGNPLLDIGSATLDENDFPTALIHFALDVLTDKSHINDLLELYEDGVNRPQVKAQTTNNLNDKQKTLVNEFKNSPKWEHYVKLLPIKAAP